MGRDLIVGITGHVQDHLLTNPSVDLLPARSGLPTSDGDVDGQCFVIDRRRARRLDVGDVAGADGSLGLPIAVGLAVA
jgi:hypothetical protein